MKADDLEPMSGPMRELLDAERQLDAVPPDTRAKLHGRLKSTLGTAAVATGVAVALKSKAAAAAASTTATGAAAVSTKLLIAVVAFSAGGGVGAAVHSAVVTRREAAAKVQPIVVRVEAPPAPVAPPVLEVATPVPSRPLPPALKKRDTLGAERSLIEQARAALSRHDALAALAALTQHEREYPQGQLEEERLALQVIATSEAGDRVRAGEHAARFRSKFGDSLLRPAVDAASPPAGR